jgi:S-DNA-T family DNA segregation ATPase FtsK/SpoIIIE
VRHKLKSFFYALKNTRLYSKIPMIDPFSPNGPKQLLADLCRLVRERSASEVEISAGLIAGKEAAEQNHQNSLESSAARHQAEKAAAEKEYASARNEIFIQFESKSRQVQKQYDAHRAEAISRFESAQAAAQQQLAAGRWEAMAISEAARSGSDLDVNDLTAGLESRWQELQTIHQQAVELLRQRGQWRDFPDLSSVELLLEEHPAQRFSHALELARSQYRALSRQFLPRFFHWFWLLGFFLLLWSAAIYPAIWWFGWKDWRWVVSSGGVAVFLFLAVGIYLFRLSNRQAAQAYLALRRTLLEAGLNRPALLKQAIAQCQQLYGAIAARRDTEIKKAETKFAAAMADIQHKKEHELQQAETSYPPQLAQLAVARDRAIQEIDEKYPRLLHDIDARYAAEAEQLDAEYARAIQENERHWRQQWTDMADRWFTGIEMFRAGIEQINNTCRDLFPDWHTSDWSRWSTPAAIPPAFRLGSGKVELARIENGIPADEKLRTAQTEFVLPALLPFPEHSLLLWKASGGGLAKAIEAMQAVMLRLLTSMPPGKVRFTIIDPVGLGENFSSFMHLADFDEQLVASRIWTDAAHIEGRLADLTKHMENVIQVYLRKEFPSIREYNAFASELAEPYRVLVVANFPANFSEVAVQRLKSIICSGARCGVFVLLSVDTKLPLSKHFRLSDLESGAMALRWDQAQFVWEHPEYGPLPLSLDTPPPAAQFREIVRTVGDQAKDATRVEVPFSSVIPPEAEWWSADSRGGIEVPLGKSGAMKLQELDLGQGTSQHVLISGKTGSGKSTLLHVLITNLALRYSPDEVELYLVDFKKGVEFKAYASFSLPHARVIAIESEREFGLSVLQRLDVEMHHRGDMFRKLGVQDLKSYRTEQSDVRLPRVLLIIDEFQELFVEDDRIAQESALLLDRLVRQGRAFGIHVLLGSQTLGGAYSLARSTIGQMAVRIALQCSETDAHLILSEDNTAARLLTRPGEAIYNDANGLYEGNHPFQVVWLPDNERDQYLQRIGQLSAQKKLATARPIIFEGNVPADPSENLGLKELLSTRRRPEAQPAPLAWLGSAVAIKEPTAAALLSQNGANLLLVGHREGAALGILANCLISLAAYHAREKEDTDVQPARFYILDGMRADAPEVGLWERLIAILPQGAKIAATRGADELLGEIAAELAARQEHSQDYGPPVYLFLHNLPRFRDLRREDDFSFSSLDNEKSASPAKQFNTIIREGPALNIHTLLWCDTYGNVSRFLDRQSLREFELRVLFQMNATDSSNLMDTPEASRLGIHVAIFYDEGQGRMEKFRPYGLPSDDWLAWVKEQLHGQGTS